MAKLDNVIREALNEINTAIKEIKQSDEDDLGALSSKFDELSALIDRIANRLSRADEVLSGNGEDNGNGNGNSNSNAKDESQEWK